MTTIKEISKTEANIKRLEDEMKKNMYLYVSSILLITQVFLMVSIVLNISNLPTNLYFLCLIITIPAFAFSSARVERFIIKKMKKKIDKIIFTERRKLRRTARLISKNQQT